MKDLRINHKKDNVIDILTEDLYNRINSCKKNYKNIIFICIGTDRATGDALAPLVGTFLSRNKNIIVYGTLDNPVHAKNLKEILHTIDTDNNLIIAIDACVGEFENIGSIKISNESIKAGSGVGKDLPEVGDVSIVGVVNLNFGDIMKIISHTRLNLIYNMGNIIYKAISRTMYKINKENLQNNLLFKKCV